MDRFNIFYNLKLFFSNMFSLGLYYVSLVMSIILLGYISIWLINWIYS